MMKPHKTVVDMMNEEYLKDQEALMDVVRSPQGVAAIQKAYNIDLSNPNLYNGYSEGIYNSSALSGEFFDSWYNDTDDEGNLVINTSPDRGNMYDIFSKL